MEWFWLVVGLGVVAFFAAGCACCGGCPTFSDNFTRADSTNIGSDWDEVAGDWSINSNRLTTSSANALAIATKDVGQSGTVEVLFVGASADRQYGRVIGAYTDEDNYVFLEIDFDYNAAPSPSGDETLAVFRLYHRQSGANTLLAEFDNQRSLNAEPTSTTGYRVVLCWTGEVASARMYFAGGTGDIDLYANLSAACTANGSRGGVGTGSAATNCVFDAFVISGGKASSSLCSECDTCERACSDGLPSSIEVTLPSTWSNKSCTACESTVNGQTYVLDRITNLYDQQTRMLHSACGGPYNFTGGTSAVTCWQTSVRGRSKSCVYMYDAGIVCYPSGYSNGIGFMVVAMLEISGTTTTLRCRVITYYFFNALCGETGHFIAEWALGKTGPLTCSGEEWSLPYSFRCGALGASSGNLCDFSTGSPGTIEAVT